MNYRQIARTAVVLALIVVVLGAWVRLSDAGLGCPDWPGCYGHLTVPASEADLNRANQAFPERPVETHKAWKEMIHRYVAGALGLMILWMAFASWRGRESLSHQTGLTTFLLALVIFQAALGMWTVTLLVKPAIVTAHLIGGMATLSLLWLVVLRQGRLGYDTPIQPLRPWAALGMVILIGQIILGGWTSTNYAALSCTDFPTCGGQWFPEADFSEGFVLWRGLGVDYEFGVLEHPARVAIHLSHRIGALITFVYLLGLALVALRSRRIEIRQSASAIILLLLIQVALGIGNVLLSLPLPVAVAHNGGAALLLLAVLTLNVALFRRKPDGFTLA
ncbi:MAG: COX15/CtaA family protein [Gammaproteobacteria bacterium]